MIQDTAYNLEVHLQRIDQKTAQFTSENTNTSDISIDLNDEREVIKQCLRVCEDARSYIKSLTIRESSLLQEVPHNYAGNDTRNCFEAKIPARQTLNENRDSFAGMHLLEDYKQVFGKEHPDTLTSMNNLSSTYWNQGRWRDTEVLETQALESRKRILGKEHSDTLTSMSNLSSIYGDQGRWQESEALGLQVLETYKQILGGDNLNTLGSMDNLATNHQNQGRWEEAEVLQKQVLGSRKRILGEEHPDTLTSMANLASTHWNQGRWEEAEVLQKQVLESRKRILGEEHPDTFPILDNLALAYQTNGKLYEAERLQLQAMESRKKVFGPEHPDTLASMENLASVFMDLNRWQEAEKLEKEVRSIQKRLLRDKHPSVLNTIKILGITDQKLSTEEASDSENSDISDPESIVTTFSYATSLSSKTTFTEPIVANGVEVFAALLLKNENFQRICKAALQEKSIPRTRIHRNLGKLFKLFASQLARETQGNQHANAIKFVRGASSSIASRVLQSPGIVDISVLDKTNIGELEETSSRAKVIGTEDVGDLTANAEPVGSDSDDHLSLEDLDLQGQEIMDELQKVENFFFQSNAFQIMERRFFDFVYPSLRSILMNWISYQRRIEIFTKEQLRDLELIVSELQHISSDQITLSLSDKRSLINSFKGKLEELTGETWDWWPLKPHMRTLAKDNARLHCECVRNST